MTYDFARIITDYRERCAKSLQEAAQGSVAQNAYQQLLWVFDQIPDQTPNARVVKIASGLVGLYQASSHPEIRAIVREWANNFSRDIGWKPSQVGY